MNGKFKVTIQDKALQKNSKYRIVYALGNSETPVLDIYPHFRHDLGIAQGICEILNRERRTILPLQI